MDKIQAFLPVRLGSERVLHKNTRPFSEAGESLLQIKLRQLIAPDLFDKIIVSTNDPKAVAQAEQFKSPKILINERPESLCSSSTRIEDLSKHAGSVCESDFVVWTHVTSPFFDTKFYKLAVAELKARTEEGFDSLASVTALQGYFLDPDHRPFFDYQDWRNWPRTQDLESFREINSAVFIVSRERLIKGARLGLRPYFQEFPQLATIDIDTELDWEFAKWVRVKGLQSL
jgi:N-acylneuraminate cytidylyltransferase